MWFTLLFEGRVAVWADLLHDEAQPPIRVYSAHTENYCDGVDRVKQLLGLIRL